MSKGSMENARVKKEITEALFTLMNKKNFSEITVTDIIKEAGVARASYYRNFEVREDIIEEYMNSMRNELMNDIDYEDHEDIYNRDNVSAGFERALTYCLTNKSYILAIYNNGFGRMLQKLFNQYIEDFAGDMPLHSIDRYKLYFISGAVCNVLIQWLEHGALEPPRAIAMACVGYLSGGIVN